MSLTADTADAIIAVDTAMKTFEEQFPEVIGFPAYRRMKEAIEGLQETACGEGMHFDSLEEARAFRQPVAAAGYHLCVGCNKPIPNGPSFGMRCGDCMDPQGSA